VEFVIRYIIGGSDDVFYNRQVETVPRTTRKQTKESQKMKSILISWIGTALTLFTWITASALPILVFLCAVATIAFTVSAWIRSQAKASGGAA
jgi:hypothetical protein